MSDNRLFFTFQNNMTFALDRRHFDKGSRIHFNFDLLQVESIYRGSLLYLVDQNEVKEKTPLIEFKLRKQLDFVYESETEDYEPKSDNEKLKSVIVTATQEIAEAPMADTNKMITGLTRSQRRNRNKRLKRQEERQLRDKRLKKDDINQLESLNLNTSSAEIQPITIPAKNISEIEIRRIQAIKRQSFEQFKHINGRTTNILEGIGLFTRVFDDSEQAAIIEHVMKARDLGRAGRLRRRTYSEPNKWIRGKGRLTIQYGCCYNYAKDNEGNPLGILRHEQVDPLPTVIIQIIKRLVTWGIAPTDCIPDSCIINIYDEGDCIPPHIDSHDFERPFCTVSLMNRCSILFGREIQILGPGEFAGTYRVLLPRGSVLLLQGNGADIVKHCIPSVDRPRISITLRRMRPDKRPIGYQVIPELEGLEPLEIP